MKFHFISAEKRPPTEVTQSIELLSRKIVSFEDLFYFWTSYTRTFGMTRLPHKSGAVLAVALEKRCSGPFAFAYPSLADAEKLYGKVPALNEEMFPFPTNGRVVPDQIWFELRNRRLGIEYNPSFRDYFVPARSAGALLLSYALSSSGSAHAHAELSEDLENRVHKVFKLVLNFYGNAWTKGWQEYYFLLEKDLLQCLADRGRPYAQRLCRQLDTVNARG